MKRALVGRLAILTIAGGVALLSVLVALAQQPAPAPPPALNVAVAPGSGPSGTTATIQISGAAPGAPVTIIIGGNGVTNATADANGNATITHTFFGRPGEVVSVVAIAGTGANDRKGSSTFTITGEAGQGPLVQPGVNMVTHTGPPTPLPQPIVRDATGMPPPESPVIIQLIRIIWRFDAGDQQWRFWTPQAQTFGSLQTGVPYVVFANRAGNLAIPAQSTEPPLTVTLTPATGPTGTSSTINVSGARPGDPITIAITGPGGRSTISGVADANGRFSETTIFRGQAGDVYSVDVTAGNGTNDRTGSGSFTITGASPQGVSLREGMNLVPYAGPTLPVAQALGPAAASVSAMWQFNAATQAWQFWTPAAPSASTIASLQSGVPYVIFARLAREWEIPPPGWVPLNVTLSQTEGPSGTTVTITVTGLKIFDTVRLNISDDPRETEEIAVQMGIGGVVTVTRQFHGFVGQQKVVIAFGPPSAGDPYTRTASAIFTVTGPPITPSPTPTRTPTPTPSPTPTPEPDPGPPGGDF